MTVFVIVTMMEPWERVSVFSATMNGLQQGTTREKAKGQAELCGDCGCKVAAHAERRRLRGRSG
jgi:hypothetical protein